MKFQVYIKDPDGFYEGLKDAVKQQLSSLQLPEDEKEQLEDIKQDKLSSFMGQWVEFGEYATLEFDTEANTAVVVSRKK